MRPDPDYIEAAISGDREVALLAAEVRRLQAVIAASEPMLTDAEREAIEEAIRRLWGFDIAATLRGLLERIGGAE
jgi:hypothetical protein